MKFDIWNAVQALFVLFAIGMAWISLKGKTKQR
jgi:hypothetical protein